MTDARNGLVMTIDDGTEIIGTTGGAAAPGTPTPVAANLACHAALNDAVNVTATATAELPVRDLETRAGLANVLRLEAAANAHARGVPRPWTDTFLEVPKSMTTVEQANEKIAETANEAIVAIASVTIVDNAAVTTAVNVHAVSGRESTIAGTGGTGAPERTETLAALEMPETPPSDQAGSKTLIDMCREMLVTPTKILAAKLSANVKNGTRAEVEAEAKIGIENVTVTETGTEIQDGVAAVQGVEIVVPEDVTRRHLQA